MLLFEPPPSQGPVKSTVPSGSNGTGRAASASEILGVPPTEIELTPPCRPCASRRTRSASVSPTMTIETTSNFLTLIPPGADETALLEAIYCLKTHGPGIA